MIDTKENRYVAVSTSQLLS